MVLNRTQIMERIDARDWDKRLVIEPFFRETIEKETVSATVDIHIGNRFTVLKRGRAVMHDPVSETKTREVPSSQLYIPMGEDFYVHPGQLILAITLEWFCFPSDLMAEVIGRSIWGRRGLLIVTAPIVQPGSSGTITLELSNVSEVAVVVKPGTAVGQLAFTQIDPPKKAKHRRSPFAGMGQPIFGEYAQSDSERFLHSL